MNIAEILNNYLLHNVLKGNIDVIYNDVFPFAEGDCLISRYDASTAKETEYIDGSAVGQQSLSYYMRSSDAAKCRMILDTIFSAVDNLVLSNGESKITILAMTRAAFISVDDKEQNIYSMEIKITYNIQSVGV